MLKSFQTRKTQGERKKKQDFVKGKLHMAFKYLFLSKCVCVGVKRGSHLLRKEFKKQMLQRTNTRTRSYT